jgi:5-methylcytosine-specific restriction protein A
MPQLPNRHRIAPAAQARRKTAERGYDATWRKLRALKLATDPLCAECERKGDVTAAAEVDHILPMSRGGERLDWANLQSLCKQCHSRKTMREQGRC